MAQFPAGSPRRLGSRPPRRPTDWRFSCEPQRLRGPTEAPKFNARLYQRSIEPRCGSSAATASIESVVNPKPSRPRQPCWQRTSTFSVASTSRIQARRPAAHSSPWIPSLEAVRDYPLRLRVNQSSIGASKAIASFGSRRGHILVIGSLTAARTKHLHGCFPSNAFPREEPRVRVARRRGCEPRFQQLPDACAVFFGSYFSSAFHIASTIAAMRRAIVSFARFGLVPFSKSPS